MESVALHDIAPGDVDRPLEAGGVVAERVKLPAFAAGIDRSREVPQQTLVEVAREETRVELLGIDAGNDGVNATRQHLAGEPPRIRRMTPDREERLDPGARELPLAVGAYILEKQVAEGHVRHARFDGVSDRAGHEPLVLLVRARTGQREDAEGEARPVGLALQQFTVNAVHRHAVDGPVHRREQSHDLDVIPLAKYVERPCGVLPRAPRQPYPLHSYNLLRKEDSDRQIQHPASERRMTTSVADQSISDIPAARWEELSRVVSVIRANMPAGYEEAVSGQYLVWQVPLARYPDTYNKRPLMYVSVAPQKNYMALYLLPAYGSEPLGRKVREGFRAAGKKLDMGKSCIRFRSADDLNLDVIGEVIAAVPVERWIEIAESARSKPRARLSAASRKAPVKRRASGKRRPPAKRKPAGKRKAARRRGAAKRR